jgi:hypothetical protein
MSSVTLSPAVGPSSDQPTMQDERAWTKVSSPPSDTRREVLRSSAHAGASLAYRRRYGALGGYRVAGCRYV